MSSCDSRCFVEPLVRASLSSTNDYPYLLIWEFFVWKAIIFASIFSGGPRSLRVVGDKACALGGTPKCSACTNHNLGCHPRREAIGDLLSLNRIKKISLRPKKGGKGDGHKNRKKKILMCSLASFRFASLLVMLRSFTTFRMTPCKCWKRSRRRTTTCIPHSSNVIPGDEGDRGPP